jgi:hypothetical protein
MAAWPSERHRLRCKRGGQQVGEVGTATHDYCSLYRVGTPVDTPGRGLCRAHRGMGWATRGNEE